MNRTKLLIFTFLLVVSSVFLGLWLVIQNFPHYGIFKVEASLGENTSIISSLGPEVRTRLTAEGQEVLESPIYFDLRVMPWFNKAEVFITYEPVGDHDLVGVGRHTGPGFSYNLQIPDVVRELENSDLKAIFIFDLNDFYQEKNIYRFLIDTSNHQYQQGSELIIKELKIFLST